MRFDFRPTAVPLEIGKNQEKRSNSKLRTCTCKQAAQAPGLQEHPKQHGGVGRDSGRERYLQAHFCVGIFKDPRTALQRSLQHRGRPAATSAEGLRPNAEATRRTAFPARLHSWRHPIADEMFNIFSIFSAITLVRQEPARDDHSSEIGHSPARPSSTPAPDFLWSQTPHKWARP
jgi:hypothetical protein